jgi:O-antigen/teichoic acid export membrane protein
MVGQVVIFAAVVCAAPFTIRLLGPAAYGLWALLQILIVYLVMADLGMRQASTKFASEAFVSGDDVGEVNAIWTALAVTLTASCIISLMIGLAAPWIIDTMHVPADLRNAGIVAVRLIAVAAVATAVANTVNTPQTVRLRWAGLTIATQGPVVLQIIAIPVALFIFGGGIRVTTLVVVATACLAVAANAVFAGRLQPKLVHPRFDWSLLRKYLGFGGGLTVAGLASVPLMTAERFFLGHFHSTVVVAEYSVAMSLSTVINVIPWTACQPLMPAMSRLHATGDRENLRSMYRQTLQAIFLALAGGTIVLGFLAEPFLRLWAGPLYGRHSTDPFLILLVGFCFAGIGYVPYNYLMSAGRTSLLAKIRLAQLGPFLVVAAVLADKFGAVGAACAWSGEMVVDMALLSWGVWHVDKIIESPTPARWQVGLALPFAICVIELGLARFTDALAVRCGIAALLLTIYSVLVWLVVLTPSERQGATKISRVILQRKARRALPRVLYEEVAN